MEETVADAALIPYAIAALLLGLAYVAQMLWSGRDGAGPPVAIPFWSENVPPEVANAIRMSTPPVKVDWSDRGRIGKTELQGNAAQVYARVSTRMGKSAPLWISYWGRVAMRGTEARIYILISPFFVLFFAAFMLLVVRFFSSADFGIFQWAFYGWMLLIIALSLVQMRVAALSGLRKLLPVERAQQSSTIQ